MNRSGELDWMVDQRIEQTDLLRTGQSEQVGNIPLLHEIQHQLAARTIFCNHTALYRCEFVECLCLSATPDQRGGDGIGTCRGEASGGQAADELSTRNLLVDEQFA